jgi:hypothetical protein
LEERERCASRKCRGGQKDKMPSLRASKSNIEVLTPNSIGYNLKNSLIQEKRLPIDIQINFFFFCLPSTEDMKVFSSIATYRRLLHPQQYKAPHHPE